MATDVVFTTLALGAEYRFHAQLLGLDCMRWHPEALLIVLTDRPNDFRLLRNVRAVKHRQVGTSFCYHDKRFALNLGLALARHCTFLDADVRLLDKLPDEFLRSQYPSIRSIYKRNALEKLRAGGAPKNGRRFLRNSVERRIKLLEKLAASEGVNFSEAEFIHEAAFSVTTDGVVHRQFLAFWDNAATYLQLRGWEWGEGSVIGLGALAAGLPITKVEGSRAWMFKDLVAGRNVVNERVQRLQLQRALIASHFRTPRWMVLGRRVGQPARYLAAVARKMSGRRSLTFPATTALSISASRGTANSAILLS